MIAPSVVKFEPDHFICGNTFRCVWALREYPTQTDEQAILRHLGEKDGITLRIYTRQVTPAEEKRIIQNAANKNRMGSSNTNDLQQTIMAESNLQDVASLVASMHRNREPLLHCAVYIELTASDYNTLKLLQTDVLTELVRSKLNVDKLLLRQQQGFRCVNPCGHNTFGIQFERVLPASSVANLYPFNYSGKLDSKGFYIGKDKYGSNILVDFDQRDEDKTSANILILGNSGQGKSYLMKLLILNLLESGKSVISLDAEHEQQEMCEAVGGCFADLMAGQYIINVLEPKCWDDGGDPNATDAPEAFRKSTLLAQHISFLKDFFRAYKDFSDAHIDTIEIMLSKLYRKFGITERTNFSRMCPEDYPILSDLYDLIEEEFKTYDADRHQLYTQKLLQEVLLGLHSMCKGADAQFFNGHTNITSSRFLVFGVKGMLSAAKNVRNAMLFNVLSFMSDKLLTVGNTVAALDELYIWLSNPTAIEYIRNCLKRVRKKESAMLLASQNLEDFDQEGVREMTKPLFSIPPHQFLFNAGSIDKRSYMDMLQLEESEYNMGNLHADVLFNLSNLLCGYNPNRVWNCSPYAGLGWARVYDSPSAKEVSANVGVFNSFRLSDALDLNLDVRGMFVNDRFDGEGGGRFGEGNLSATIGLTYKFKNRGWGRSKTVTRYVYNYGDLESMRSKLNDMSAENERLKKALADGDRQKAQTIVKKIAAANLVIFQINKTKLSNEARANLGLLAEIIKSGDPDAVYTITGYADAGTGNRKGNERLSKERAENVYDCLVNEFGVSEKQLRIDYKGGVENMFYNDPRLSRAVITRGE